MKNDSIFSSFTQVYKLSKTLRFELKPVGKTLEYIKSTGVLDRDLVRNENYQHVKDVLDAEHKALLERTLSSANEFVRCLSTADKKKFNTILLDNKINWQLLSDAYKSFRKSGKSKDDKAVLQKITDLYRKLIVAVLQSDDMFDGLTDSTPSKFFKLFLSSAKEKGMEPDSAVELFASFACYFKGYQENRKNIYSDKQQSTAASSRAIDENFTKFMECCTIYELMLTKYGNVLVAAEKELVEVLDGKNLSDIFDVNAYSNYLSQSGINYFNAVIGGYTKPDGTKIRGLNEFINLTRQQDIKAKQDRNLAQMPKLYKQILSDRETMSFVYEAFENDQDVLCAIHKFAESLESSKFISRLCDCLNEIEVDKDIYVAKDKLSEISMYLCGSWRELEDGYTRKLESQVAIIPTKTSRDKEFKRLCAIEEIKLKDLSDIIVPDREAENGMKQISVAQYWDKDTVSKFIGATNEAFSLAKTAMINPEKTGLKERNKDVQAIKEYLDALQNLLHYVSPLKVNTSIARDINFYGQFDSIYEELAQVIPLYNKVRNYVTKKPSEVQKMKLMFDCPTLADGWDVNKELQNRAMLFIKEGKYYLGIIKTGATVSFQEKNKDSDCYQKMIYKLLPGPNKTLPHVFFSSKGISTYKPSKELIERYKNGDYKKGATFDLKFCHQLINYFKDCIKQYPGWDVFNFKFSPTEQYKGIDEFYREVSEQGYKVSFVNVSSNLIDTAVEEGRLYLFQIYNKDFADGANGRPNMHTLYWKALFAEENFKHLIYKLNGEAELFYRAASIRDAFVHRLGEKLVNRRDSNGQPLPEKVFAELYSYVNGRLAQKQLSKDAKVLLEGNGVIIKDVKHEIIKDRRYCEDKFFFHVPITINTYSPDDPKKFNDLVNNTIRSSKGVNVIGIDRGERHLIYVCVVDPNGKILEQRSFNTLGVNTHGGKVANFDYQAKLDECERARDAARKSWSEIGKIKDLKSGYLSLVVHEIAKLMLKYNAVIALEDLNFGFKRGRFAIEKQVYQKFEKALIDKLNYLVFKDCEIGLGSVLNGYQLTDKFESFEKLGKQTGFLYYVPASYTSKIDPTTGFTNLFDFKSCTSSDSIKDFFTKFDAIYYSAKHDSFVFSFDYMNFKTRLKGKKTNWDVYSAKRRLVYNKTINAGKGGEEEINPTQIIKETFAKYMVKLADGFNLLSFVNDLPTSRENAAFYKSLFYAFERTLQMRNSCSTTGEDYIESPVLNANGVHFDSRVSEDDTPKNADANGAYHIALKGLWMITVGLSSDKANLKLDNETWFEYVQNK